MYVFTNLRTGGVTHIVELLPAAKENIKVFQAKESQRMADSASESEGPPAPAGGSHSQQELSNHPVWRVARGARPAGPSQPGRGRGRGRGGTDDAPGTARYERLSLLSVELQGGLCDGASTLLSSDDEERHSEQQVPREGRAGRESREAMDYDDESSSEDEEAPRRKKRAPGRRSDDVDVAARAAALGSSGALFGDDESDSESIQSRTSSKRKRDNAKQAFPLRGVNCVGCSLAHKTGPVEKFISDNIGKMSETALWKMSALVWKRDVMEPARREGVHVVDWPWKSIATHFKVHTTNPVVGRTAMINSLTAMRMQAESKLLRVEGDERELDKGSADLVLKILAAESRERSLLAMASGKSRSGQRPAGGDE